jgi:hypothetical protein
MGKSITPRRPVTLAVTTASIVLLALQSRPALADAPADASPGIDSTAIADLAALNPLTVALTCVQGRVPNVGSVGIATAFDQYVAWIDMTTANYPTYKLRDKNLRTGTIVNVETGMYESSLDMHGDQLVVETVDSLTSPTVGYIVGIRRTGQPPIIPPYLQTIEQTTNLITHHPRVFDTQNGTAGTEAFIWDDPRNIGIGNLWDIFERVNGAAEQDVYIDTGDQLRPTTWYDGTTQLMAWESRTYEGGENGQICVTTERHVCHQVSHLPLNWTPDGTPHPNIASCERVTYTSKSSSGAPFSVHVADVQKLSPATYCLNSPYQDVSIDSNNAINPRINLAGTFVIYGRITGAGTYDLWVADISTPTPQFTLLKAGACGNPGVSSRLWAMDRYNGRAAVYYDTCGATPCGGPGIVKVTW